MGQPGGDGQGIEVRERGFSGRIQSRERGIVWAYNRTVLI